MLAAAAAAERSVCRSTKRGERTTECWRWRRSDASLCASMAKSLLLLLLIISGSHDVLRGSVAAVSRAKNHGRSPLQKWLDAEWVQKYESSFHWFVHQHHSVQNMSFRPAYAYAPIGADGRIPVARKAEYSTEDRRSSAIKAGGGYIIVKLDKLSRQDRRTVRREMNEHGMRDIHIIDDLHLLVYVDSPRVSRFRSALKADASGSVPLSFLTVLDIYSTAAGARLKLSRVLRIALNRCDKRVSGTSSWQQRLKLDVRTAPGREAIVKESLDSVTSRLATTAGKGRCRWEILTTVAEKGIVRWLLTHYPNDAPIEMGVTCYCSHFIDAVIKHPAVRWMEVAVEYAASLNYHASALLQQGEQNENKPLWPFWKAGINGSGEIIGMADTGIDYDSCFFSDPAEKVALYPNVNYRHRKLISVVPCEIIQGDYGIGDKENGHGTHVSGTAAGHVLGGNSEFKYDGVAKGAKLFFTGLGCPSEPLLSLPLDLTDIFLPSYKAGARVLSNSWGFFLSAEYSSMEKSIDSFSSEKDDALLIFAAGNSPSSGLMAPCRAKNVFCVGGHLNSFDPEKQNTVAGFSSFGPTYDSRVKPEVVGPGKAVISAYSDGDLTTNQCSTGRKQGTSMATAAVAGVAALIRQHLRERENITSPSGSLLKALLIHSTVRLRNPLESGFGRIDLSIFFTPQGTKGWLHDRGSVVHHGTEMYCFTMTPVATNPTEMVRTTLAWTDVGSSLEGSTHSVINDLDLLVVNSLGNIYYAGSDGKVDRDNVLEQIRLPLSETLAAGFRVFVYGSNVYDEMMQPYALVVSGPNLQHVDDCGRLPALTCANNCSGNGECVKGVCKCATGYRFIDCSLCDEELICHGHGTCSAKDLKCTCDNDHFADEACSVCKEGWYGQSCSSNCTCSGRGNCNTLTGECTCQKDAKQGGSGCFSGPNCEYCCTDFYGEQCNLRSYWCRQDEFPVEVNDTAGAYIQFSGYGTYPPMMSCQWVILAPRGYKVRLEYLEFNLADEVDFLTVSEESGELSRDTGTAAKGKVVVSSYNVLSILFISDWSFFHGGFVLHYTFEKANAPNCTFSCVKSATCDAVGGGFCVCDLDKVGWKCELAATTVAATPIGLEANHSEDPTHIILPINGEVHFTLSGHDSSGSNARLHLAFSEEEFVAQNHEMALRVVVVRGSNIVSNVGVAHEEILIIPDSCRCMEIGLGDAVMRMGSTVNLLITLLHNASLVSNVSSQSNFSLVEAVYVTGSESDYFPGVEKNPNYLLMQCNSTSPIWVSGKTSFNKTNTTGIKFGNIKSSLIAVLLIILLVTALVAAAAFLRNYTGANDYVLEIPSDETSLSEFIIEEVSDEFGIDVMGVANDDNRVNLFLDMQRPPLVYVGNAEDRIAVGTPEDGHISSRLTLTEKDENHKGDISVQIK